MLSNYAKVSSAQKISDALITTYHINKSEAIPITISNYTIGSAVDEISLKLAPPEPSVPSIDTTPTYPQQPQDLAPVSSSDHVKGSNTAPVTMIEYADFQCPFCGRFYDTLKQVETNYSGKVRFVYRHFPLNSIHPYAQKAAEASECASDQGKFWEMHDAIFELNKANTLTLDTIKQAAVTLNLDLTAFNSCLDGGTKAARVAADYQTGLTAGVNGTPSTFVNGTNIAGALPYDSVKQIIDQALSVATP